LANQTQRGGDRRTKQYTVSLRMAKGLVFAGFSETTLARAEAGIPASPGRWLPQVWFSNSGKSKGVTIRYPVAIAGDA
jgi:hypothetical protein